MNKYILIILLFLFGFCKKVNETELEKNRDILLAHNWGIPEIEQGSLLSVPIFLNSPTVFNENGYVEFGTVYQDNWTFVDERTIRFHITDVDWNIISISDSLLHVNMLKMKTADFIAECIFDALN